MIQCRITPAIRPVPCDSLRAVLAGFCLFAASLVSAQIPLIELGHADAGSLDAPSEGEFVAPVRIRRSQLQELSISDEFSIQLGDGQDITLTVEQMTRYLNGDVGISAIGATAGILHRLTLTAGPTSLFGHANAGSRVWQIEAAAEGNEYRGWVYEPQGLTGNSGALQQDYRIPAESKKAAKRLATPSPLRIGAIGSGDQPEAVSDVMTASIDGIHAGNLAISQVFTPDPVVIGETSSGQIQLQNTSTETHSGLTVEIYFLLEDSELLSADSNCSEQTSLSLQPVLYCQLGDIGPGQTASINLTVQTSASSQPYMSSSVFVGNLRHDQFINVVEDVRTDSDADGISDFNEQLLGTDPQDPASADYSITTIDVMSLYTPGAERAYAHGVETRINQLIGVANQVYRDSGVAITLRPVHHERVSYNDVDDMDTALDALLDSSHVAFNGVAELRQRYGADLVMLFRPIEITADRCGLAPIGGFRSNGYMDAAIESAFAFSTIAIDCPIDIVVAHELGHNMGLSHSHLEDGHGGTFNFSTGYGVEGQFTTVMAYPGAFGTETRVARFSDPLADCFGFACGEDSKSDTGADAVQSLNLVRHQVGNYLPTTVPDLPATTVSALSGSTNAVIAIAASKDQGLSFSNRFSPHDSVDITATIAVDPRHVGLRGSIHVMVGEFGAETLYQIGADGQLIEWNGELATLVPMGDTRVLPQEERLQLLNDFQFDASLVGRKLVVYIAYQVSAEGDLIYTDAPLSFEIVGGAPVN